MQIKKPSCIESAENFVKILVRVNRGEYRKEDKTLD